jgi:hypothetical protein
VRVERLAEGERKGRGTVERALDGIDEDEFAARIRSRRRFGRDRSMKEDADDHQRGQQADEKELGSHCGCCRRSITTAQACRAMMAECGLDAAAATLFGAIGPQQR